MKSLMEIHNRLKEKYDVENWWPIYDGKEPFTEISVGAILTQNTNWKNVEKAIRNLISEDILSLEILKDIDIKILEKAIKPAGFYKRKAQTIKEFSKNVLNQKNINRDFLLSIKGIGKETADSILLYGLNEPIFVIDSYTKRLFGRLGFVNPNETYNNLQKFFMDNLPDDYILFQEFHAGIVEHSKAVCKKIPDCENCLLKDICKKEI